MATYLPDNSTPPNVRCLLCNLLVKAPALAGHVNKTCLARPKPGQQISPGTCPHCLAAVPVNKMETHLLHSCHVLTVPCPFCQYRFLYIEQHLQKKHFDKQRTKQFQQLRNTRNPYYPNKSAAKHTPSYSDLKQPECPPSFSRCPVCHTYMREKKLASHVKSHFKILCPFCKKKFDKSGLATHLVNKCLYKNTSYSSSGLVKCPSCKKQDSIHKIAQHLTLSHLTLCCPICSGTLGSKRVISHLNICSGKNASPSLSQSPLRQGVFQKFREFAGNDDVYSESEDSLTDEDSSDDDDDDELDYVYETPANFKSHRSTSSGCKKSKPFHAPFQDPTDPSYVLLPAHHRRGKKGGHTEDLVSTPYISMGHKISCPICNSDCPLRMMGRHIIENHITHQCPICKNNLSNSSFKVHLEECMGRYGAREGKGRPTYSCPYCSQAKCHSVREMSTHIHRNHRQLNCPFCQEEYSPHSYCKHVNKCAKLSVISAQLIQDNPSLDPEMIQLYQQLQIGSSENNSYSEGDSDKETPLPTKERTVNSSAHPAKESYANRSGGKAKQEAKNGCCFCHFQCSKVPLEDHIVECRNIPVGMQVVSMGNLLGLRINSAS